jgi:hypothetical protein
VVSGVLFIFLLLFLLGALLNLKGKGVLPDLLVKKLLLFLSLPLYAL